MAVQIIPFKDALDETNAIRRHLLLGNGFSISAWRKFRYENLKDMACENNDRLTEIFRNAGTSNFEEVLSVVQGLDDAKFIRDEFVRTIISVHPQRRDIPENKRLACAKFLSHFLRASRDRLRGTIFTTNYDLLPYWLMPEYPDILDCPDAFNGKGTFIKDQMAGGSRASIVYLHGAVHLHNLPRPRSPIRKVLTGPKHNLLMDRIREYLSEGQVPIIVTEGTHARKARAIEANVYLTAAMNRFEWACGFAQDALFVFGHTLGAMDFHINQKILRGRIGRVFISAYTARDCLRAQTLDEEWNNRRRNAGMAEIIVKVFVADDAEVWGRYDLTNESAPAAQP